jgi:dihydrofolate reductase
VIVLSSSLPAVRSDAELYNGTIPDLIEKLHSEGVQSIYADGGKTISQFLNAGLIDQMIISVIPLLLGSGIPLFNELQKEIWWDLKGSQAYANGLVQLRYEIKR